MFLRKVWQPTTTTKHTNFLKPRVCPINKATAADFSGQTWKPMAPLSHTYGPGNPQSDQVLADGFHWGYDDASWAGLTPRCQRQSMTTVDTTAISHRRTSPPLCGTGPTYSVQACSQWHLTCLVPYMIKEAPEAAALPCQLPQAPSLPGHCGAPPSG